MTNPFAHHTTLDAVTADWLERRNRLDKWEHRQERAELAAHAANRWDQIRKSR
jgi:hypothetical protein